MERIRKIVIQCLIGHMSRDVATIVLGYADGGTACRIAALRSMLVMLNGVLCLTQDCATTLNDAYIVFVKGPGRGIDIICRSTSSTYVPYRYFSDRTWEVCGICGGQSAGQLAFWRGRGNAETAIYLCSACMSSPGSFAWIGYGAPEEEIASGVAYMTERAYIFRRRIGGFRVD